MSRCIKFVGLCATALNLVAVGFAQGILEAALTPDGPSSPPLAGYALILTPNTNGGGLTYPVSFQISINSDQVVLNTGRIFGGSTAWAFSLGTPTTNNGTMFFGGTTDMEAFQINDILAENTQLEVTDSIGFTSDLVGPVFAVPEPSTMALGCLASILFFPLKFQRALLNTHERALSKINSDN